MLDISNRTKQFYNQSGPYFSKSRQKTYDNNTSTWPETKPYLDRLRGGSKVLDLGCGNGRLLTGIKADVDYLGVDFSKTLIKEARRLHPNYKFIVADVTDDNFWKSLRNKKYNAIFCIATLHHIESKEKQIYILKKIAEHLKDGGYVFMTVWNTLNKRFWKWHFKNVCLKLKNFRLLKYPFANKWDRFLFTYDKKYIKKLVSKTNLRLEKMFYSDKKGKEIGFTKGRNLVFSLNKPA